jgi:energy-coupling factor transporter ATP-binding protein EcfA2
VRSVSEPGAEVAKVEERIKVSSLVKRFGTFTAVDDVSFAVHENEFFSLLGPSGCGKTTTLRCISGLEQPTEGDIYICGNLHNVIDDLIDDVGIDAIHSFQDEIVPVGDFKEQYGHRVAVLGGIDVDKLCRMDEASLRSYVRTTIDRCMPRGWALGSGNSIANYVPVRNFLIMMDEGARWRG